MSGNYLIDLYPDLMFRNILKVGFAATPRASIRLALRSSPLFIIFYGCEVLNTSPGRAGGAAVVLTC